MVRDSPLPQWSALPEPESSAPPTDDELEPSASLSTISGKRKAAGPNASPNKRTTKLPRLSLDSAVSPVPENNPLPSASQLSYVASAPPRASLPGSSRSISKTAEPSRKSLSERLLKPSSHGRNSLACTTVVRRTAKEKQKQLSSSPSPGPPEPQIPRLPPRPQFRSMRGSSPMYPLLSARLKGRSTQSDFPSGSPTASKSLPSNSSLKPRLSKKSNLPISTPLDIIEISSDDDNSTLHTDFIPRRQSQTTLPKSPRTPNTPQGNKLGSIDISELGDDNNDPIITTSNPRRSQPCALNEKPRTRPKSRRSLPNGVLSGATPDLSRSAPSSLVPGFRQLSDGVFELIDDEETDNSPTMSMLIPSSLSVGTSNINTDDNRSLEALPFVSHNQQTAAEPVSSTSGTCATEMDLDVPCSPEPVGDCVMAHATASSYTDMDSLPISAGVELFSLGPSSSAQVGPEALSDGVADTSMTHNMRETRDILASPKCTPSRNTNTETTLDPPELKLEKEIFSPPRTPAPDSLSVSQPPSSTRSLDEMRRMRRMALGNISSSPLGHASFSLPNLSSNVIRPPINRSPSRPSSHSSSPVLASRHSPLRSPGTTDSCFRSPVLSSQSSPAAAELPTQTLLAEGSALPLDDETPIQTCDGNNLADIGAITPVLDQDVDYPLEYWDGPYEAPVSTPASEGSLANDGPVDQIIDNLEEDATGSLSQHVLSGDLSGQNPETLSDGRASLVMNTDEDPNVTPEVDQSISLAHQRGRDLSSMHTTILVRDALDSSFLESTSAGITDSSSVTVHDAPMPPVIGIPNTIPADPTPTEENYTTTPVLSDDHSFFVPSGLANVTDDVDTAADDAAEAVGELTLDGTSEGSVMDAAEGFLHEDDSDHEISFTVVPNAELPRMKPRPTRPRKIITSPQPGLEDHSMTSTDELGADGIRLSRESLPSSRASSPLPTFDFPLIVAADVDQDSAEATVQKVFTWRDLIADQSFFDPPYYHARDLPHTLQDYLNAMDTWSRSLEGMRSVFETMVHENTAVDEPHAPHITVANNIDNDPCPPWEFCYSNHMWHNDGVPPPTFKGLEGCDCYPKCDPKKKKCKCLLRQKTVSGGYISDFAYDANGRIIEDDVPIVECNDLCRCDDDCPNRVVQNGRKCAIKIGKTKGKGWGVFAGARIPKGTYIGIYAGELITEMVAEERGLLYNKSGRTYLFDLDFYHLRTTDDPDWSPKYVVDAYHVGNFTRFLNHSCSPNAKLVACYINEANVEKPLLTIFASRDIKEDEEVCFSYSGAADEDEDNDEPAGAQKDAIYVECRCGAKNCKGVMFR